MTLVHPARELRGTVAVPASKPHCQRAVLFTTLAAGESRVHGFDSGTETALLVRAGEQYGARLAVEAGTLRVRGCGGRPAVPGSVLRTAGSGMALRNLLAVSTLAGGPSVLTGNHRLRERPVTPLVDALRGLGARVEHIDPDTALPVWSHGGGLAGGTVSVPAGETSQFVTALLLVAPYARDRVTIRVPGPVVGRHYIRMTLAMMREFGARVGAGPDLTEIEVEPGGYAARELRVGPDVTALFCVVAAAVVTRAHIHVPGVRLGVDRFLDAAVGIGRRIGVRVVQDGDAICVSSAQPPAEPVDIDATDVPTLVPALAAVAASLPNGLRLTGAAHLRHHKTSRLDVLLGELARLGRVLAPVYRDGELDGFRTAGSRPPRADRVDAHGDHRLFMALYLACLGAPQPIRVAGAQTLTASFPGFLDAFADLSTASDSDARRQPA